MSLHVILCRHGNTFQKGERVYMVGAGEDLPLTSHGLEQGRLVGEAIKGAGSIPSAIISGPLKRTRMFAEQVKTVTGYCGDVLLDDRLTEFDYGAWSGLSNEEIVALSGEESLRKWQEESIRPPGVNFSPSDGVAQAEASGVMKELESKEGCVVLVTSNGRLRAFGRAISKTESSFKVRTGHSCLVCREASEWRVKGWDLSPQDLLKELRESLG